MGTLKYLQHSAEVSGAAMLPRVPTEDAPANESDKTTADPAPEESHVRQLWSAVASWARGSGN